MEKFNIYKDIAERTDGEIYLGVVGPVRTGKSTFISKFINEAILPAVNGKYKRERVIDDMPQSADGKTIMTTQPRFVPEEGIKLAIEGIDAKMRLVDCVGFMVKGALGAEDNGKPRMVKTPWSNKPVTFNEAAEIGTKKVINEHSTIGIVMTTDGSFTGIDRKEYEKAERKAVEEIKASGKPAVIILNTSDPKGEKTAELVNDMKTQYGLNVLPYDVANLKSNDINTILECVLFEFPLESIDIKFPKWLQALPESNPLIENVLSEVKKASREIEKMKDYELLKDLFKDSEDYEPLAYEMLVASEGKVSFVLTPKKELFYRVLSEESGVEIADDFALVSGLKDLAYAKVKYDRLKSALDEVDRTGYGVVAPDIDEMRLEVPELVNKGGKVGLKLKASAPSLHIMKVDIDTEINPLVGSEAQTEDLIKYLMSEFENNPKALWEKDMFGKSLNSLVKENLTNKIMSMPDDIRNKFKKTLNRIVNEGKGGMICILL